MKSVILVGGKPGGKRSGAAIHGEARDSGFRVAKSVHSQGGEPVQVLDLVERWKFLTGLPFVFAFWVALEGFTDKSVVDTLVKCLEYGLANIPAYRRDVISAARTESRRADDMRRMIENAGIIPRQRTTLYERYVN